MKVFPNDRCREFYGDEFVGDKMLCAGHEEGGVDACQVRIVFKKQFLDGLAQCIDEKLQYPYFLGRFRRPDDPAGGGQAELRAGGRDLVGVRLRAEGAARRLRQGRR